MKKVTGLLEYTQSKNTEYGQYINERYFANTPDGEKEAIGFTDRILREELMKWRGKYPNYITYLNQVLGEDVYSRHVRYVNDFLSGQFIENALRQSEVGVVRDINVAVAKQGIITTNLNNMSGKDTPLGTITNYMYANSLYNGAIFNSDRHSENKYLTPTLINQYGNNLANVMELGDMLRVGTNDYEIREDLGADAYIIHDLNEPLKGSLNLKYIVDQADKATRYVDSHFSGYKGYYEIGKEGYVKLEHDGNNYNRVKVGLDDLRTETLEGQYKGDKTYLTYGEPDAKGGAPVINGDFEWDAQWELYNKTADSNLNNKTLLSRTTELFNQNKINTLIGRFHTTVNTDDPLVNNQLEFIDTAKSKFGNSHGRNLLTRDAQENGNGSTANGIGNGYENPYCRTWTYHHQYNQVKKLIRPFMDGDRPLSISDVQNRLGRYRSRYKLSDGTEEYGGNYLAENTVLNNNGFVNICPSNQTDNTVALKNCMFSLENLAWKDVPKDEKFNYISKEQQGPNGGRIMWFPPYDLSFQENVNVDWEQNTFIGRGEKVYTYKNTDRTGTLSFTMLIDHPSIINSFAKLSDSNGGKGYSVSDDIDMDILRFFAGCDIPNIKPVEEKKETKTEIAPKQDPIIETKSGSISFNVYFPNNYSGTMTKNRDANYFQVNTPGENGNQYEPNWWQYLLFGNNGKYFDNKDKWIGYEVLSGELSGISGDYNSEPSLDDINKTWIPVCKTWAEKPGRSDVIGLACKEAWSESSTGGTGTNVYKYKVDPDLQQKLRSADSYVDKKSFQLNGILDTNNSKTATHTFAEIVCALLKSKKLQWSGTATNVDEAVQYLIDNSGVREDEIEKLAELFSNDNVTYTTVSFSGSATEKDQPNSQMLARRRAMSVQKLLGETLFTNQKVETNIIGRPSISTPGQEVQSISGLNDKLQRSTSVTLEFKYPDTLTELEDNSALATTPKQDNGSESGSTSGETDEFTVWYNELISGSSIMREYKAMFEMEDYQQEYETFKRDIKQLCEEKNISTDLSEYDDNKWNETVNLLLETYGNKPSEDDIKPLYLQYISPLSSQTIDYEDISKQKMELFYNKMWESKVLSDIDTYYEAIMSVGDHVITINDEYIRESGVSETLNLYTYNSEGIQILEYFVGEEQTISENKILLDALLFNYILKDVDSGFESVLNDKIFADKGQIVYYQLYSVTEEKLSGITEEMTVETIKAEWALPLAVYNMYKNVRSIQLSDLSKLFETYMELNTACDNAITIVNSVTDEGGIDDEKYGLLLKQINTINSLLNEYVCSDDWHCLINISNYLYLETPEKRTNLINKINESQKDVLVELSNNAYNIANSTNEKVNSNLISYGKNAAKDDEESLVEEEKQIIQQKYEAAKKQEEEAVKERVKQNNIYQAFNGTLVTRYETEADYFSKLEVTDPLIFKSLKQKFKYFNPAFHSMSPEGFNARLNFLQQCTRQGHTVEVGTSLGSGAANNLAFGRMPVCVLRIGDFINTRIIIQNMSIQYDNSGGMQWDLNPEGIGVQPMYAKVSLGIVLLGGQSLEGPISRLQNAITFDYYANTGVYDDRADRATYIGNNGEQKYTNVFVAKNTDAEKETDTNSNAQANEEIQEKKEPIKKAQEKVDNKAKSTGTPMND